MHCVSDYKVFTRASHAEFCTLVEARVQDGEKMEDIATELRMRPRTLASIMHSWRQEA